MTLSLRIVCLGLCQLTWAAHWLGAAEIAPARIQLREEVVLSDSQVRLGDIARIDDTDDARRAELERLDLADFDQKTSLELPRDRVQVRILLAGFSQEAFRLTGAKTVVISPPAPAHLTDLGVEQAVYEALCRQFDMAPEDLRLKLVSSFIGPWLPEPASLQQPRLELLPSPQLPLGRVQLTIRVRDGERIIASRPATFDVARRQQVLVAASTVNRSSILQPEQVREETRYVESAVDQITAEQVIGRQVLLSLKPGELVTLRHIGERPEEEKPILVQTRDAVRLTARKGSLLVTVPVAEALQSGREGQLIRVRNLQSNKIVTGRIIGRGEVEVLLQ